MADKIPYSDSGVLASVRSAAAVTPSDDTDLDYHTRALHIGTKGNLSVVLADDDDPVLLKNIANGTVLAMRVKRVMATNTTASDIVALY